MTWSNQYVCYYGLSKFETGNPSSSNKTRIVIDIIEDNILRNYEFI